MKHILVADGAGYIGSACAEYLLDMGYKVTVFDARFTGHRESLRAVQVIRRV
jgi:UDP-glucose 4-epimerase